MTFCEGPVTFYTGLVNNNEKKEPFAKQVDQLKLKGQEFATPLGEEQRPPWGECRSIAAAVCETNGGKMRS